MDISEIYGAGFLLNLNWEKWLVPLRPFSSFWFMNHSPCHRTLKIKNVWFFLFLLITCLFKMLKLAQMRIKNSQTKLHTLQRLPLTQSFLKLSDIFLQGKTRHYHSIWLAYHAMISSIFFFISSSRFGPSKKYTMPLEILPSVLS